MISILIATLRRQHGSLPRWVLPAGLGAILLTACTTPSPESAGDQAQAATTPIAATDGGSEQMALLAPIKEFAGLRVRLEATINDGDLGFRLNGVKYGPDGFNLQSALIAETRLPLDSRKGYADQVGNFVEGFTIAVTRDQIVTWSEMESVEMRIVGSRGTERGVLPGSYFSEFLLGVDNRFAVKP